MLLFGIKIEKLNEDYIFYIGILVLHSNNYYFSKIFYDFF